MPSPVVPRSCAQLFISYSPFFLTLDPTGSAAFLEEYLFCLRSLSEDTAFVSFPSSMAHSHDTPCLLLHLPGCRTLVPSCRRHCSRPRSCP